MSCKTEYCYEHYWPDCKNCPEMGDTCDGDPEVLEAEE